MKSKVIQGNNIDILKEYPDNHFDSIVTDPPYGIEFLAKEWDSNTGAVETWQECFRVLKPGGYLLAFSAARTYHNLATNIEGVGFDIRDQLMWLYASGFPKAQDVGKAIDKRMGKVDKNYGASKSINYSFVETNKTQGIRCKKCDKDISFRYECQDTECGQKYTHKSKQGKQWAGWKTALKPAHEPIVMARKPFKGSCVDNVLTHGVGALNIDATRISIIGDDTRSGGSNGMSRLTFGEGETKNKDSKIGYVPEEQGRFPSNVLGEIEGYQKYFYCPKVSRAERSIGCDNLKQDYIETVAGSEGGKNGEWFCNVCSKSYNGSNDHTECGDDKYWKESAPQGNNHPTVKPVALMRYLMKLVTPQGGKVLDPFTGSGSTGMAAVELDYDFTGCELDPDYVNIAETRITAWKNKTDLDKNPLPEVWFEEK